MFECPDTIKGMADLIIDQIEKGGDKFELREDDFSYHLIGNTPRILLSHAYKSAPDLNVAIEAFSVMATIFEHYGANETLIQEWFEYNVIRWSMTHNVSKETLNKIIKKAAE